MEIEELKKELQDAESLGETKTRPLGYSSVLVFAQSWSRATLNKTMKFGDSHSNLNLNNKFLTII